ncbi:MAG: DUF4145 domain-containing protein [bacterium]
MIGEKLSRYCNICRRSTLQESVFGYTSPIQVRFPDRFEGMVFFGYEAFKCSFCSSISMRVVAACSPGVQIYETWYPPEIIRHIPSWWGDLKDSEIKSLAEEVYSSLDHGNTRVAAMGIRTLIEHISEDKTGETGSFRAKIRALLAEGILNPAGSEILSTVLEFGHAAVHRKYAPSVQDVARALSIIENLIDQIYVIPPIATELKNNVPPRPS